MRIRRLRLFVAALLMLASFVVAGPQSAYAAKKTYEDKKLGFKLRIEDSYTQTPPKLTSDEAYIVGDWYEDSPKYDAWGLRPGFQVFWFAEPRLAPPVPGAAPPAPPTPPVAPGDGGAEDGPEVGPEGGPPGGPPGGPGPDEPSVEDLQKQFRDANRTKSFDEAVDRLFKYNERLFGPFVAISDRWAAAEKDKTDSKLTFEWFEVNAPTKKKKSDEKAPPGFSFVARLTIERPQETIHVGFLGSCGTEYLKRFRSEFPAIVRSFSELKNATDSRNEGAQQDLSDDPAKKRAEIKKNKVLKDWKCVDTDNYVVLHHTDVDPSLARSIGTQIEAIREQVYEKLFPPDKSITAVSVVRVCKDQQQYSQYGGPGGSAGYWSPYEQELVFYEDQSNKKDSLRVLYHEAFHQYIFYSVGDFSPHSWFNEGHGDFFAGHNYMGGRFVPDVFQWRVSGAKEWKRNPKRPPLKEWVSWTQAQYYGRNAAKVPIGANYELGWSLVYFLRTTKKPEYQGVLDRYFKSLKGAVSRKRDADEAWKKRIDDWKAKLKTEPDTPRPERSATDAVGTPDQWLKRANEEAFEDIDWDQIEKDWLASDY